MYTTERIESKSRRFNSIVFKKYVGIGLIVLSILTFIIFAGFQVRKVFAKDQNNVLTPLADENWVPFFTPVPSPTATPTPSPTPTPTPSPTPTPLPTPTPVPSPTPIVTAPGELDDMFNRYASEYGVDANMLKRIADCEAHFNTGAANGDFLGMFQFSTSTWTVNRQRMGLDTNPQLRTHREESIKTAAFVLSHAGTRPWPNCP